MATQQSVLLARWDSAFYNAMALLADARLSPELANLILIRRAVEEAGAFYGRLGGLDKDELRRLSRQGLELAQSFRALLDALHIEAGHPLHEAWDGFAGEAEDLAIALDPETEHSREEARRDLLEGHTTSLADLRQSLGL